MTDETENFELEKGDSPEIFEFSKKLEGLSTMDLLSVRALIGDKLNARVAAEKLQFIEDIQARAAGFGLEVRVSPFKTRAPKEIKYLNPDDPKQTWSGRGQRPRWIIGKLEAGVTLESLLADKE